MPGRRQWFSIRFSKNSFVRKIIACAAVPGMAMNFRSDLAMNLGEPNFKVDPEAYVNHIAKAKEAVRIPIIGSLNGSTFGGWQRYARQIEQAGADALELNIYNGADGSGPQRRRY